MTDQSPDKTIEGGLGESPNIPTEKIVKPTRKTKRDNKAAASFVKLETLAVEDVPIDSIFPNNYNPNRQTDREFQMLKNSIKEDGFSQPVVVLRGTRTIVDGEHRWRACNQLGFKTIPVVFVDMTAVQARISTFRHNRARGSEDTELSTKVLKDLRSLGALEKAVASLGISDNELNILLNDAPSSEQMANGQFSPAWLPNTVAEEPVAEETTKNRHVSTSEAALVIGKEYSAAIEETAKTSIIQAGELGKRVAVVLETVTVQLNGAGDSDILFIKKALGNRPAEYLLKLACFWMIENPARIEGVRNHAHRNAMFDVIKRVTGTYPELSELVDAQ